MIKSRIAERWCEFLAPYILKEFSLYHLRLELEEVVVDVWPSTGKYMDLENKKRYVAVEPIGVVEYMYKKAGLTPPESLAVTLADPTKKVRSKKPETARFIVQIQDFTNTEDKAAIDLANDFMANMEEIEVIDVTISRLGFPESIDEVIYVVYKALI